MKRITFIFSKECMISMDFNETLIEQILSQFDDDQFIILEGVQGKEDKDQTINKFIINKNLLQVVEIKETPKEEK